MAVRDDKNRETRGGVGDLHDGFGENAITTSLMIQGRDELYSQVFLN